MPKLRNLKIEILCQKYEKTQYQRAAESRGMTLSAWVRDTLRMQMIRDRALVTEAAKGPEVAKG